jgi:hypothetical protein
MSNKDIIAKIKQNLDSYTTPFNIDSTKAIAALKLCVEVMDAMQDEITVLRKLLQEKQERQ